MTHKDVFGIHRVETERSRAGHKYFGACARNPIANLGGQSVRGQDDKGEIIDLAFDVADISRPLASVGGMVTKCNKVVFDHDNSYIENKRSGKRTYLRMENQLYYLDIWVQVPKSIASNPFVRQADP